MKSKFIIGDALITKKTLQVIHNPQRKLCDTMFDLVITSWKVVANKYIAIAKTDFLKVVRNDTVGNLPGG